MKRSLSVILILLAAWSSGLAQTKISEQGFMISPHFGLQKPIGDLGDRFDPFASLGLAVYYKAKNKFCYGIEYDWFFGDKLKEAGTFSELIGASGQLIDNEGNFSVVRLGIRGNYATANVGYLIAHNPSHPNSGILVNVGAGFMQHRIDVFASELTVPQLSGEYKKGYDKLTYGLAFKQFVGYQYLVNSNKYHIRTGIEFNQGLTQGRRTWDFNANKSGLDERFDGTIAFKFGIILPIYTKELDDEEFFID